MSLTSCTSQSNHFKVGGVDGEYCLPQGYSPQGVWFVPGDAPATPSGFSFMGCGYLSQKRQVTCALPKDLISAHVEPLSEAAKRGHTWGQLRGAALYDMIARNADTEYSIDQDTGMLVLFNKNAWRTWFIWKRNMENGNTFPLAMRDDDELVASCSEIDTPPTGVDAIARNGAYSCERYVQGSSYALNYRFVSNIRVPSENELKNLDAALFEQVDRWHCREQ